MSAACSDNRHRTLSAKNAVSGVKQTPLPIPCSIDSVDSIEQVAGPCINSQEDINNFSMGHAPETMSETYSRLELDLRLADRSQWVSVSPFRPF
jgi:hypothetical protein